MQILTPEEIDLRKKEVNQIPKPPINQVLANNGAINNNAIIDVGLKAREILDGQKTVFLTQNNEINKQTSIKSDEKELSIKETEKELEPEKEPIAIKNDKKEIEPVKDDTKESEPEKELALVKSDEKEPVAVKNDGEKLPVAPTGELEVVAKDDEKKLTPAINDKKEDLPTVAKEELEIVPIEKEKAVLPSVAEKDLELIKTDEQAVELSGDTAKTDDNLKSAELPKTTMSPNVAFFREELMKDIMAAQNAAKEKEKEELANNQVESEQAVEKDASTITNDSPQGATLIVSDDLNKVDKPQSSNGNPQSSNGNPQINSNKPQPVQPSSDKSQPIDGLNIVKAARTGAELGIKVDQAQSRVPNFENTGEVIQKPGAEGGAAFVIEGTYTPEQLRAKKIKKVLTASITVVCIVAVVVLGYYFGWPYLRDYMGSF